MPLARWSVSFRRWGLWLGAVAVIVYSLGVLAYVATSPEIGLRCAFGTEVLLVRDGRFEGPEPRPGDVITHVAGQRVESYVHLNRVVQDLRPPGRFRLQRGWADVEAVLRPDEPLRTTYHWVKRGDDHLVRVDLIRTDPENPAQTASLSTWCYVRRLPTEELLLTVVWFVLEMGIFAIGAFVFWKRPADPSALVFFVLCIITVGAFMGGYHWSIIARETSLIFPFAMFAVLLPVVTLHFYLLFPRPSQWLRHHGRLTFSVVYGVPLGFLLVILSLMGAVLYVQNAGYEAAAIRSLLDLLRRVIYAYLAVAAGYLVACMACLVHSYRISRTQAERNQVKWILFGAVPAMLPLGYTLYLAVDDQAHFALGGAKVPMFVASLLFTVAYAVSITRYKLMQVEWFISRGVLYFAVSSAVALVYYAVVGLGSLLVSSRLRVELPQQAMVVGSTVIVIAIGLGLLRDRFQKALDRRFYREKYQLDKALRRMSVAVGNLVEPATVGERLLRSGLEVLGFSWGAVFLRGEAGGRFEAVASVGRPARLGALEPDSALVSALEREPSLRNVYALAAGADPAVRQLRELGGELARALGFEDRLVGLVILGPKQTQAPYDPEDLTFLGALAELTVLALHSTEGHRTIEQLNRELQTKVEKISEQQRRILVLQNQLLDRQTDAAAENEEDEFHFEEIKGSSAAVREMLAVVRKVAASQSVVLIRGESGTGKELLARAIHFNSPRASGPFVRLHCAALSAGLLESELFGHVKGAFTGAHRDKAGRFEMADGGTLFLDEIGDISLETQTKLLRVLQEMTFERVGSAEPIQVDVRLIAATHQYLEELIRQGRFREDLYYRLNVISIESPPLRERKEDIFELALHFLEKYAAEARKNISRIDEEALEALVAYRWPGNIRQLENVIERAVVLAEGSSLTLADLPGEVYEGGLAADGDGRGVERSAMDVPESEAAPSPARASVMVRSVRRDRPTNGDGPRDRQAELKPLGGALPSPAAEHGVTSEPAAGTLPAVLEQLEHRRLVQALSAARGNKAKAARLLGLPRSTFFSKLRKYGLA